MMDSKNNKQQQQQQNSVSGELEETGHDSHGDLENQGQEFWCHSKQNGRSLGDF